MSKGSLRCFCMTLLLALKGQAARNWSSSFSRSKVCNNHNDNLEYMNRQILKIFSFEHRRLECNVLEQYHVVLLHPYIKRPLEISKRH